MKNVSRIFFPFFLIALFMPLAVFATHGGFHLVSCGTSEQAPKLSTLQFEGTAPEDITEREVSLIPAQCTICDIFVMGQNILNLLLYDISIPLAALMFAYGGFLMLTGGIASPDKYMKGKKVLINTVIGIAIIFFAWLGVDTVMKLFASKLVASASESPFGPWNKIECVSRPPAGLLPGGASPGGRSPGGKTPGGTSGPKRQSCTDCSNLSVPRGPNTCAGQAGGQICQINTIVNDRLVELNKSILKDKGANYWQVTEAFPPTIQHQNTCHSSGTCIDANFKQPAYKGSPDEIKYFIEKAKAAQLNPVYEVTTQQRAQELIQKGVPTGNIEVVQRITGEHFSVYLPK